MELRERVWAYLLEHPYTTHHQCAEALRESELAVLHEIHALRREGRIKVNVRPLGNEKDPDSSGFFSAIGRRKNIDTP